MMILIYKFHILTDKHLGLLYWQLILVQQAGHQYGLRLLQVEPLRRRYLHVLRISLPVLQAALPQLQRDLQYLQVQEQITSLQQSHVMVSTAQDQSPQLFLQVR